MDVQCHIGMVDAYRGALSCLFTEIVHNGIFYFIGHELGVTEFVRENHSVYGKTFIFIQEVFPCNGFDSFVNFVGILRLKMFNGFQDADGSTQAEVCLIHHFFIAHKGYHASSYFYIAGSQLGEFFCQYFFQSLESLGD